MAFEGLTEKISAAFKKLRGKGRLKESDVKEAMREIRMALLEADVSYKVVKDFTKSVTERCVGSDVLESLTFTIADEGDNVDAPWYWDGTPYTVEPGDETVGAYTLESVQIPFAESIVTYETYAELCVRCSYSDYQKIAAMLPRFGAVIDDVIYEDEVRVLFAVKAPLVGEVDAALQEMSAGTLAAQRLGERFDYR